MAGDHETDPAEELRRTRRIRQLRVEAAGFPDQEVCGVCSGVTVDVDDPTVACDCAARQADLNRRLTLIRHEHRDRSLDGLSDRIAP